MTTDSKPWWRDLSIGVGATVVGGWLLARNWDDLSSWLAEEVKVHRWLLLASPVIAIVGAIATTKVLMWWHSKVRPAEQRAAPTAAPTPAPPPPTIPDNFVPTERQALATSVLMHYWPNRVELQSMFALIQQANAKSGNAPLQLHKVQLARDLEKLEAIGMVRIDNLGERVRYYYLTTAGRDWLLEARELPE